MFATGNDPPSSQAQEVFKPTLKNGEKQFSVGKHSELPLCLGKTFNHPRSDIVMHADFFLNTRS